VKIYAARGRSKPDGKGVTKLGERNKKRNKRNTTRTGRAISTTILRRFERLSVKNLGH